MNEQQEAEQAIPINNNFFADTLHRSREIIGQVREVPNDHIDRVFAEGYESEFWKELYKVICSLKGQYDNEAKSLATASFDLEKSGLAFLVNSIVQEVLDTLVAKVEMSYKSILMLDENERTAEKTQKIETKEAI